MIREGERVPVLGEAVWSDGQVHQFWSQRGWVHYSPLRLVSWVTLNK